MVAPFYYFENTMTTNHFFLEFKMLKSYSNRSVSVFQNHFLFHHPRMRCAMKVFLVFFTVISAFLQLHAGIEVFEDGPWLRSNLLLIYDGTRPVPKSPSGKYKIPDWARAIWWIAYEKCPHLCAREDCDLRNYEIPPEVDEISVFMTVACSICNPVQVSDPPCYHAPLASGDIYLYDHVEYDYNPNVIQPRLVYRGLQNHDKPMSTSPFSAILKDEHPHVYRTRHCAECYPPKTVIVPEGVTSIGGASLMDCEAEGIIGRSIILPSSLTTIDGWTFTNEQLKHIQQIYIPQNVTSIHPKAFRPYDFACLVQPGKFIVSPKNLNYASLDNNLCTKDGKTLIMAGTPDGETITIPKSVTRPKEDIPFDDAIALHSAVTKFIVAEDHPDFSTINGYLCSKDGKELIKIPAGLKDIRIPDSITAIHENVLPCSPRINSITYRKGLQFLTSSSRPGFEFLCDYYSTACRDCRQRMSCGKIRMTTITDPEQTGDFSLIRVTFKHITWDEYRMEGCQTEEQ